MSGMIDPRTQWLIYKDNERDLLLAIQQRQSPANETLYPPAQPWYTQAAAWLSRIVQRIQPGKQPVENVSLACCTPCGVCCPSS